MSLEPDLLRDFGGLLDILNVNGTPWILGHFLFKEYKDVWFFNNPLNIYCFDILFLAVL